MAHTPGPWWNESGVIHARGPHWTEKNHNCVHLGTVYFPDGVSLGTGYDNASLMAAAPDLLAALEEVMDLYAANALVVAGHQEWSRLQAWAEHAHAACTKARGE